MQTESRAGASRGFLGLQRRCALILLLPAVASTITLLGCVKTSDQNQSVAQTKRSLQMWADYVIESQKAGIDPRQFGSTTDILAKWRSLRVIGNSESKWLEKDSWGSTFRWKKTTHDNITVIVIISDGRNRIPENGLGDDLSIGVSISNDGSAKVVSSKE
jgi:hypothetical protein